MIHPAVLIPLEYAFERLLMLITGVYIARRSTWDHTHSSVALGGSDSGVKFIFTGGSSSASRHSLWFGRWRWLCGGSRSFAACSKINM